MFITKDDLKNNLYNYQIEQITEGDDTIVLQAIHSAITEVKSYLEGNHKKEYLDGRPRYDVNAVFSAQGENRNALLVQHCVVIARWYIVDLCNADMIYQHAQERYDRSVDWLKQLAKGTVNIADLPMINEVTSNTETERLPFLFGSRTKFNHD